MNCPGCNAPVIPGAVFCDTCGVKLPQAAQPAGQAAAPGGVTCPSCAADNVPGSLFCDHCGTPLPRHAAQQPTVRPAPQAMQQPAQPVAIPGRFVVTAANVSLPIPPGKAEIIIGREDPVSGIFPDIDLDPYGAHSLGVSRMHARLTLQSGRVCIEDLKTANATSLRGQRLTPGQCYPLNHGDELALGRLRLVYFAR